METQLRNYQGKSARMSRLVTILRAAHCRSTHHYIAIDSLPLIATVCGQRLGQLLLKYHDEYLVGAKAPDKSFRDFQNHVLHVNQNNWGGAPKACQKWYDEAADLLAAKKWKKAAYACGVLSHYFTDPFMPLHTAQSDQESAVHRPLEWSVCKSYESLYARSNEMHIEPIAFSNSNNWIGEAVTEGARRSNRIYNTIIDDYDLKLGCKTPTEGLGETSREGLSEVIGLTLRSWADVLIRLADSADVEIPDVSLTLSTLLATIDMPLAWIVRKISDTNEQAAVKRIFREYEATGTVRRNAPAEVKKVAIELAKNPPQTSRSPAATSREVVYASHQDQSTVTLRPVAEDSVEVPVRREKIKQVAVEAPPAQPANSATGADAAFTQTTVSAQHHEAVTAPVTTATATDQAPATRKTIVTTRQTTAPDPQQNSKSLGDADNKRKPEPFVAKQSNKMTLSEARAQASTVATSRPASKPAFSSETPSSQPPASTASSKSSEMPQREVAVQETIETQPVPSPTSEGTHSPDVTHQNSRRTSRRSTPNVSVRTRVTYDNDLVDAPSIGPKTAARFAKIGIHKIGEFVQADPAEMHSGLDTRWITEQLIIEWQDQAKLVCDVPVLCGYKAQLLVAAGCRTSRDLARSVPADLYQRVAHVARGIDGQRILRSAKPPASQDISSWITAALERTNKAA